MDSFNPDFSNLNNDKVAKRFDDIVKWTQNFIDNYKISSNIDLNFRSGIETIEEVATLLNTAYWKRMTMTLEGFLKSKTNNELVVHHTKIISGLELTIIDIQPFLLNDSDDTLLVNTEFALFVGLTILCAWNDFEVNNIIKLLEEDSELKEFWSDHQTWLINVKPEFEYPVFLNSQVWALFHKLITNSKINEAKSNSFIR